MIQLVRTVQILLQIIAQVAIRQAQTINIFSQVILLHWTKENAKVNVTHIS